MTKNRIENIWRLLLYASEFYHDIITAKERHNINEKHKTEFYSGYEIDVVKNPDRIPHLLATILVDAVNKRLKRNLSVRYERRKGDLDRVRGSIDVLRTERLRLLQQGKVSCTFEDLTVDTPPNRFVRATLVKLSRIILQHRDVIDKSEQLAAQCRSAANYLGRLGVGYDAAIDPCRLNTGSLLGHLGRLEAVDKKVLDAAHLACRLDLPKPSSDPQKHYLPELFERAILGFYRFHAKDISANMVSGLARTEWGAKNVTSDNYSTDEIRRLIPQMEQDIVLELPDYKIVIETKYSTMLNKSKRGKLKSENMYQLCAYLGSHEETTRKKIIGILLYGADDTPENRCIKMNIRRYDIRFAVVDLNGTIEDIRSHLLNIVRPEYGA